MCSVHILTHCLFGVQMQKMNVIVRVCAILVMMGGTLAQNVVDYDYEIADVIVTEDKCVFEYQAIRETEMEQAIRFIADHLDCKANAEHGKCERRIAPGGIRRRAVEVESVLGWTSCVRMSVINNAAPGFEERHMTKEQILASLVGDNFKNCIINSEELGVIHRGYFFQVASLYYVIEVNHLISGICDDEFPGGTFTCTEELGATVGLDSFCQHSGGMQDRFCSPQTISPVQCEPTLGNCPDPCG